MRRPMNQNVLPATLKAAAIAAALLAGSIGGCVGYNIYPAELGSGGFSDPNSPPVYQLMTQSLKWAVKKYPPGGQLIATASDVPIAPSEAEAVAAMTGAGAETPRVAISLFSEMKPDIYAYAVKQIGQGAVPLTPETEHLPRYMVSRVWVSGDQAKVDVFKPVQGVSPDGAPLYQPITVNLRGGMKFWRVTAYRVWSIGTLTAPGPEYFPGSVAPPPMPAAEPVPADMTPETPAPSPTPASEPQDDPPAGADVPSDPA